MSLFRFSINFSCILPFITIWIGVISAIDVFAQSDEPDTLQYELQEIEIRATRDTETEARAPFSVSVITRSISEQRSEPAFSFDRIASEVPGIWVNDRQNYALGERISIRGMGWRTAFGVRGIYVLMDDIPLTVPDGQTVLDVLDPAMVRQIEVIRGPSSSFWGNAGGGTLFLSTLPASFEPSAQARIYGGSHGTYSAQVSGTHREGPRGYHLNASYLNREGYRDHSQYSAFRMAGHMEWQLEAGRELRFSGAFVDSPDTRHPGSLSESQLATNRQAATPIFENASAGKAWRQGQLGATLKSESSIGDWQGTVYGIARSLHNYLPFADIEVDRLSGGSRISLTNENNYFNWGIGTDLAIQYDDRLNYDYEDGFVRGDLVIDQNEMVLNGALFTRMRTNWERFNISGGLRFDAIKFKNDDHLMAGGEDQSGSRDFTAVSPSLGVSYYTTPGLLYVNYGTSFETPTTTELVNRPDMTGGFNPDIDPIRATGLESGFRGALSDFNLKYDIALFRMFVKDQLISYQTEEGGDREFYRNAGETRHDGLELALRWRSMTWLELYANYNWSRFTFRSEDGAPAEEHTFIAGNKLPGIPEHRLMSGVIFLPGSFLISLSMELLDSYYVDNANTTMNPGFEVFHLRMSHEGLSLTDQITISPFLTINNITDTEYNSSVSINANGGRYFEPAPGRAFYAGFSLNL